MTKISDEDRARLLASKAEHERQMAEAEETERVARQETAKTAFDAGVEWARKTATYKELSTLVCAKVADSLLRHDGGGPFAVARAYSKTDFQAGAKSVLDELE